jgi:hypothetical protein
MRAKIHFLLVVVVVVAAFVVGRLDNAGAQPSSAPRVVWEYKDGANLNQNQMNALGADGWELCSMATYGRDLYYIFKRAK